MRRRCEYVIAYNERGHRVRVFGQGSEWFWQTACDSLDLGSEPVGPFDCAEHAYESACDDLWDEDLPPFEDVV